MKLVTFLLLLFSAYPLFGQLGFCEGSKGDPIFHEDFGTGNSPGPALPASVTSYSYVTGDPNDGSYTISNTIGRNITSWHTRLPSTSLSNGRALIVNASYSAGQFYHTEITGLCQSTTYEFSAYLMNLYDRSSGVCENGGIPNNVKFQIWDQTETVLLKEGDTGNLQSTSSPQWKQFALTFQSEAGQGSVILKMFNNGIGGCGNDLAIDDIMFRSCGDFTEVTQEGASNVNLQVCQEEAPVDLTLKANSDGTVYTSHFYQWQESFDGEAFTDIAGKTADLLNIPTLSTSKFYRVKVAENALNLQGNLCSSASEAFFVEVLETPTAPIPMGNVIICSNQPNPGLEVQAASGVSIYWYDAATGGNLLAENSPSLMPTASGTYYAEARNTGADCTASPRTAVNFTIVPAPQVADLTVHLCPNATTNLSAGLANMSYLWSTGATTSSISVNAPGSYTVKIISPQGCSSIKAIEVMAVEIPVIKEMVSDGTSVNITLEASGNFEFSLNGSHFQQSPHFPSVKGGIYTAYVRNVAGCKVVTKDFAHLVFPKFLTPNNDGYNDYFEVKGLSFFGSSQIRIFDRYGRLLFSRSNADFQWNGTLGGIKLPSDDYWYEVKMEGFESIKGHFSLVR